MSKKSTKLPKHIAGFKIPKPLRKNSGPLLEMLDTPQFKALVGTALAAGAAVLAEQNFGKGKWTAKKAKRRLKFFAAEGEDRASEIAEPIGRAVASAIGAHLPHRGKAEPAH